MPIRIDPKRTLKLRVGTPVPEVVVNAANSAAAAATSSAASAAAAQAAQHAAEIAGAAAYATVDDGTATLINTPASQTRQALEAIFTTERPVLVDNFRQAGDPDDGASFRRAAAAADKVLLKERTYTVSPTTLASGLRQCVPQSHGVAWVGPGRDVCTVKVTANPGEYQSIFGADTGSTNPDASILADLSGLSLNGFTIDGNGTDNPITSFDNQLKKPAGGVSRHRSGVVVNVGRDISITGMGFVDFQSIWCVQALGQNLHEVDVSNNRFTRIGSDTVNWDHTSIYLDCGTIGTASNNFFEARAHAARQPLELHGSSKMAAGNVARGYVYGMDITGSIWHGPGSGIASGNQLLGVASGLDIWTGANYGVAGQYGIDGFTFDNNLVTVDHARWAGAWYCGMVTLNNGATLPMRGLTISNNTTRLLGMGTPASIDQYSQAISLTRSAGATAVTGSDNHDRDITIERNRVFGSVAGFTKYVHPSGGITGLTVRDNTVRDVGQGGSSAYDSTANSALLVQTGTVRNSRHERNSYSDTRTPRGLQRGSYYIASTLDNVFDDGSRITTGDGNPLTLVSTTATTGAVSWRGTVPRFDPAAHPAATGVQKFLPGSLVTDERTGKTYKQVGSSGVNWVETA
ncbi:hypothetical protein [Calidifontibacter indicus]|uniref:hypothetical protein n=1 Tax=Calidifontibacter indicus TaxID=419650 RepID=UPI003D7061B2